MKITRRTLARMLAATAAVSGAEAQTPSQASPSNGIDEDATAARELLQSNARDIAKVTLPMATEPAFRFKA
jgi:hypothetical protein